MFYIDAINYLYGLVGRGWRDVFLWEEKVGRHQVVADLSQSLLNDGLGQHRRSRLPRYRAGHLATDPTDRLPHHRLRQQRRLRHQYIHRVSKNCAKLFLSEVCQMSTNFDNFRHTDSTKDRCTHFPPHLISVNTLPCYTQLLQIVT